TMMTPHCVRQLAGDILPEAEDLAYLANGASRAIADNSRGQGSAPARIAPVDMLDYFFAAFMFEIHIDIGRLLALAAEKPLEQHFEFVGVDGSNAQQIANRGVRRRTAPLAE